MPARRWWITYWRCWHAAAVIRASKPGCPRAPGWRCCVRRGRGRCCPAAAMCCPMMCRRCSCRWPGIVWCLPPMPAPARRWRRRCSTAWRWIETGADGSTCPPRHFPAVLNTRTSMSGSATRASSSAAADHGGGERMRIPQALQRFVRPRAIEPLPIRLHRRRIYVLPTPYGLFFALLLVAMTVGALNYNNNPALILCFLLLSLMLSCLLRGYLNLSGVQLETLDAQPVHAGQVQRLRLRFRSERRRGCEGL